MMHHRIGALLLGVFACLLLGFGGMAQGQLDIVTTTTDLKSLAEFVGGDLVQVDSIATGREDVHMLAAKPSYMVRANRAGLWIRKGLEFEIGFEPLVLEGARNPDIHVGRRGHLDASQDVRILGVPTVPVDRSMGDVHPLGNPHYHLDPLNGRIMAETIATRLRQLDPGNADVYAANLERFQRDLDVSMFGEDAVEAIGGEQLWELKTRGELESTLDDRDVSVGGWYASMRPYRGARIVTYHKSWTYFADRFNLEIVDELESRPGIPPSSRHLAQLVQRIPAENVQLILMEPFYSRRAPDLVSERTNIPVVEVGNSVNMQPEATNYITMFDNIISQFTAALNELDA